MEGTVKRDTERVISRTTSSTRQNRFKSRLWRVSLYVSSPQTKPKTIETYNLIHRYPKSISKTIFFRKSDTQGWNWQTSTGLWEGDFHRSQVFESIGLGFCRKFPKLDIFVNFSKFSLTNPLQIVAQRPYPIFFAKNRRKDLTKIYSPSLK